MTEETFTKGITFLKEVFPSRQINPRLYFEALKDIEDEDFEKAIMKIVQTHKELYPDSNLIAILREYCGGRLEDHAVLAWDTAIIATKKYGYYATVSFTDEITNGVIQAMGGWESFSSMLISEQPFRRKEFLELYKAYARSGRYSPEKLIGNFERINQEVEQTKLIEADYLRKDQKQIQ